VISNYSAAKLRELGISPDRISLIYPGAELDSVSNSVSETHDELTRDKELLSDRRTLLTVGRLITRKGHDRVIEALPDIARRIPGIEYVIVGTGSEEQRLRDLAEAHGIASSVTFVGGVPHESVSTYYRNADVFVHPNRELANGEVEGFGMVFIEASAFGVPVIGGNTGGTPDAILDGETGFLVDPNSLEDITERVVQLMSDGLLRARMGEAGREWAAGFTWDRAARELSEISEMAAQRTRGGTTTVV
jgi:phosphatidylinositol alpha-1,6-mannosyltransferase